MNRREAYEIMKNDGCVTHPVLVKAGIGPLSLIGNTIYVNDNQPLGVEWKTQIDSQIFNDGWIAYAPEETPRK